MDKPENARFNIHLVRRRKTKPRPPVLKQCELAAAVGVPWHVLGSWLKKEDAPTGKRLGKNLVYNRQDALKWATEQKEKWLEKQKTKQ